MIITRTPLRISIGGGGTDLPSYYQSFGGAIVSAAIDKYVFIGINRTFTSDYLLKYSEIERVDTASEIAHPILREALERHPLEPGVEIVSLADIPSGTGLGSSGSFTVGLLRAIYAHNRKATTPAQIAAEASIIEMENLGLPVGKQDQYIASYGGITCFDFHPDESVTASPLGISGDTLRDLEEHLMLFFTGYSRAAESILADQNERSKAGDDGMLDALHHTKELGLEIKRTLEDGNTHLYGKLMHEHWLAKRERSPGMSNPAIDRWYELALANGAVGGKLVGAGAGGFLLLYAEEPRRVRQALTAAGLNELRFRFDHDGSTVVSRG